jgi:penicillin amidase
VGVTLPGAPGVVAGSNGSIAWGHTNVTGDFLDWIDLVPDPADPNRYLTAAGSEAFGSVTHTIEVAGRAPTTLTRRTTRWGVVTDGDDERPDRVMLWTALDPARHTFGILDLFEADTLERGLDIAARWLGPPQNVVIASADGRIGWTISGAIPVREGFQGDASACSDTLDRAWIGDLAPQDKPRVIDPPAGFLVTANSRTVGGAAGDRIGSNWALGVRSHRIAEVLAAAEATDERAMLDLQLDTDGGWLELYRELALGALGDDPPSDLARAREILEAWNGTADADQPGHALVRWFRARLSSEVVASILQRFEGSRQWHGISWFNLEEAVRRILEERPDHLIPPPHETWRDAHLAALREAVVSMGGPERLDRPWGERNRLDMRHAFTEALGAGPFGVLGRLLDMPNHSQPGATRIVRVAGPGFGASQRLVVSPGREDLGILHMPGGQAGHFLSRHYRLGHEDWAEGRPTPLLPGEPRHRLRLRPQAR